MKTVSTLHAVAIACLGRRPALTQAELEFFAGLDSVVDLLWNSVARTDNHSKPAAPGETPAALDQIQCFLNGINQLAPLAKDSDAAHVATVLRHLPQYWRNLPAAVLTLMAERLANAEEATMALVHLEMRHIARWLSSAATPRKADAGLPWEDLIRNALEWEPSDEILLRQSPCDWPSPVVAEAYVAAFDLCPVVRSAQLVGTLHHKGVLCNLGRRDACMAGREAWFFGESRVRKGGTPGQCLFGLFRSDENAPWTTHEAYAPPHLLDSIHRCALSVMARHNSTVLRTRIRENLSGGLGLQAAIQALKAILQAFRQA